MYDEYKLAWANIEVLITQRRRTANAERDRAFPRGSQKLTRIHFEDAAAAPSSVRLRLPIAQRCW